MEKHFADFYYQNFIINLLKLHLYKFLKWICFTYILSWVSTKSNKLIKIITYSFSSLVRKLFCSVLTRTEFYSINSEISVSNSSVAFERISFYLIRSHSLF